MNPFKKITGEILSAAEKRLNNHLIGSILLAFAIIHWKITLYLIFGGEFGRVYLIQGEIENVTLWGILLPIGIGVFYTFGWIHIEAGIDYLLNKWEVGYSDMIKNTRLELSIEEIENENEFIKEKSRMMETHFFNARGNVEDLIKQLLSLPKETERKDIVFYEDLIRAMGNNINSLNMEIVNLKGHYEKLWKYKENREKFLREKRKNERFKKLQQEVKPNGLS